MDNVSIINSMAYFHLSANSFPDRLTEIEIKCSKNGIFVKGGWWANPSQKVTYIYFDGLRLRLFMGEKFFTIHEEDCRGSGFSLKELYEKLEEVLVLT